MESLSWIDYVKTKYNMPYLENMIYLLLLSLICSVIIYLSLYFPVFHTALIIFVVLGIAIFLINNYYKNLYEENISHIKERMKKIDTIIANLSSWYRGLDLPPIICVLFGYRELYIFDDSIFSPLFQNTLFGGSSYFIYKCMIIYKYK